MTAPTGDDALREAIRDELSGWPLGGGYYQYTVGTDEAREMADALLPVVLRYGREKVAEELRAAAAELPMAPKLLESNHILSRRVAALTAQDPT